MASLMDAFREALRKRMAHQGVDVKTLANRLGKSPQFLRTLLSGKRAPNLELVEKIAEALGCSPFELLGTPHPEGHASGGNVGLNGIEAEYANAAFRALFRAMGSLRNCPVDLAQEPARGKPSTVHVDAGAEQVIMDDLRDFNQQAPIVTEETWRVIRDWFREEQPVWVMDPLDRTSPLLNELKRFGGKSYTIGQAFADADFQMGKRNFLLDCWAALTLVRNSVIVFSILLDYRTGRYFLATRTLAKAFQPANDTLPPTVAMVASQGDDVGFPESSDLTFAAYVGDELQAEGGATDYAKNLEALGLTEGDAQRAVGQPVEELFRRPPGPARILYLSNKYENSKRAGFILSNGEKVTEWIHWLPWVLARRTELRACELWTAQPTTRHGVLMSPGPVYSLFSPRDDHPGGQPGVEQVLKVDWSRVRNLRNPGEYRGAIAVAPRSNRSFVARFTARKEYRELLF